MNLNINNQFRIIGWFTLVVSLFFKGNNALIFNFISLVCFASSIVLSFIEMKKNKGE